MDIRERKRWRGEQTVTACGAEKDLQEIFARPEYPVDGHRGVDARPQAVHRAEALVVVYVRSAFVHLRAAQRDAPRDVLDSVALPMHKWGIRAGAPTATLGPHGRWGVRTTYSSRARGSHIAHGRRAARYARASSRLFQVSRRLSVARAVSFMMSSGFSS